MTPERCLEKLHDVHRDFLQSWGIQGHLIFFVLLVFSKVSMVNTCDLLIGGWRSGSFFCTLTGIGPGAG